MSFKQPKKWTLGSLTKVLSKKDLNNIKVFAERNFETLGGGAYRNTYLVRLGKKKVVLKLPLAYGDYNSLEVENWILSHKSKGLATLLAYDKKGHEQERCLWILAEYIPKPISYSKLDKLMDYVGLNSRSIPKKYRAAARVIHKLPLYDTHEENIGCRRDGTVVVLDYAG